MIEDVRGNGEIAANIDELLAAVKTFKDEIVYPGLDYEASSMNVFSNTAKAKVMVMEQLNEKAKVSTAWLTDKAVDNIEVKAFFDTVKRAQKFIAKDRISGLAALRFEGVDGVMNLIAADGYTLFKKELISTRFEEPFMLKRDDVIALTKVEKLFNTQYFSVYYYNDKVILTDAKGAAVCAFTVYDEFYPEWKKAFPTKYEVRLEVYNPKELIDSLKAAKSYHTSSNPMKVRINGNVELSVTDQFVREIPDILKDEGKELEIGFNPDYLINAIGNEKGSFNMNFADKNQPVHIIKAHNEELLVMPIRLI